MAPGLLAPFRTLDEASFPTAENLGGSPAGIQIKSAEGTALSNPTPYTTDLQSGSVLVSVQKSGRAALVDTPARTVSGCANAAVLVDYNNGVMRVANLTGVANAVRVKFGGQVYSVPAGVELIVASQPFTKSDLRPADGLARRNMQVLQGVDAAIAEFSVESSLEGSSLISGLLASSVKGEQRVHNKIARMAAVLNYVAGAEGFTKQ
jgi:hypothetical protein